MKFIWCCYLINLLIWSEPLLGEIVINTHIWSAATRICQIGKQGAQIAMQTWRPTVDLRAITLAQHIIVPLAKTMTAIQAMALSMTDPQALLILTVQGELYSIILTTQKLIYLGKLSDYFTNPDCATANLTVVTWQNGEQALLVAVDALRPGCLVVKIPQQQVAGAETTAALSQVIYAPAAVTAITTKAHYNALSMPKNIFFGVKLATGAAIWQVNLTDGSDTMQIVNINKITDLILLATKQRTVIDAIVVYDAKQLWLEPYLTTTTSINLLKSRQLPADLQTVIIGPAVQTTDFSWYLVDLQNYLFSNNFALSVPLAANSKIFLRHGVVICATANIDQPLLMVNSKTGTIMPPGIVQHVTGNGLLPQVDQAVILFWCPAYEQHVLLQADTINFALSYFNLPFDKTKILSWRRAK